MKKISIILFLSLVSFGNFQLYAQNWLLGGNNLPANQALWRLGSNNNTSVIFETFNIERGRITTGGLWGIGTAAPERKLHVFNGSAGAMTAHANSPFVVENSTHNYLSVLAPAASERGILFGDPANAQDGGIIYAGASNQLHFRTNGNLTRMALTNVGNLGLGTTAPLRKFQVQDGDIRISRTASTAKYFEFVSTVSGHNDVRLEHSSSGSSLYFSSSSNDFSTFKDLARFDLLASPSYVFTVYGSALASGGVWQDSDVKLKKDINDFKSAMDIVDKLQAKTYFFKTDGFNKLNLPVSKQYGFIAQEVEKVLPELVKTSLQPVSVDANGERQMEEVKAVNYTAFIPILTQALQDQKQTIKNQQKIISSMQDRLVKAEAAINAISIINNKDFGNKGLSGASLSLAPNPVKGYTKIHYKIDKDANAQFLFHNNKGQLIKTIQAPTNGQLEINTQDFVTGTYIITLIINQEVAESTKMVVGN